MQRLANELKLKTTIPYRVWFEGKQVHSKLQLFSRKNHIPKILTICPLNALHSEIFFRQVGGWTQVYGDVLTFATIRGASHEAPFSQPERSLVLFRAFLQGRPLPETF